jgi:hypothetical protein
MYWLLIEAPPFHNVWDIQIRSIERRSGTTIILREKDLRIIRNGRRKSGYQDI